MSYEMLTYSFNYDQQIKRVDCPKEDAGKWLEDQAIAYACSKYGPGWAVAGTQLLEYAGRHEYLVKLQRPAGSHFGTLAA